MSFTLFTDSNSDLPYQEMDALGIEMIYMPYSIDGSDSYSDLGRGGVLPEFYRLMRSGKTPTTSLLTKEKYVEYFDPHLAKGEDVLFVCMSSELSGTYNNAVLAVEELKARYPQRKLHIINSRNISMGEGFLAIEAAKRREAGQSLEEVASWVEGQKYHLRYWFTVENLSYLRNSGRISSATAFMGTLLDIKPILTVSRDGRLVPAEKAQGRKKAMRRMITLMEGEIAPKEQTITIMHADCLPDAQVLEGMLRERLPEAKTRIEMVGPTIGTHAGPGTLAVVYLGEER